MIKKITYEDKIPIKTDETVARKNKVTAEDFNEIKEVVNTNAELLQTNSNNIKSLQKENIEIKQEISNIREKIGDIDTILDTINGEVI